VIVVDDASPRPARLELGSLGPRERAQVTLVEQSNAGPGAARNAGLEALEAGIELVAYLDSDDWWSVDHLARAGQSIDAGCDLYLSNWMPLESQRDAYTHFDKLDLAEHEPLAGQDELWRYRGEFFRQELSRPIGRLSTMVFRRARYGDLRFDPRLRTAFEDRLYRLEMARRHPEITFSTRPECFSGEGVNLFSGKPWGTPGRLDVARDELLALKIVRRRFALSAGEAELVASIAAAEREAAVTTLARLFLRERRWELRRVARILAVDPTLALRWPAILLAARRSQGTRRRNAQ
jgi:succinoglycan biosynthesis protein ExoW